MAKITRIRWRGADTLRLQKAVNNFNSKRTRLIKNNPSIKNLLPQKVTVSELKRNTLSRNDLNKQVNSLKRFSKRGAEQIVTTSRGVILTVKQVKKLTDKSDLDILTRFEQRELKNIIRIKNIKLASERKINKIDLRDELLSAEDRARFAPRKFKGRNRRRKKKALTTPLATDFNLLARMETYKRNYFSALDKEHLNSSPQEVAQVKAIINRMPIEKFARLSVNNDELSIQFNYDPNDQKAVMQRILSGWQRVA